MRPAVLFDLDGTLVDHETASRSAVLAWARTVGAGDVPPPDEEPAIEWARLERQHFGEYLAGAISFQEQRRRRMHGILVFLEQPSAPADTLDSLFANYLEHYTRAWTAYADAVPALSGLRAQGVTLGVLTNGQQEQQRAKLDAVGLLSFFDVVIASSTLSAPKPATTAFAEACDRLGRRPQEVYYVGDHPLTDALAATRAGMVGVRLNRQGKLTPQEPDHRISSLSELAALVGAEMVGTA